MWRWVALVLSVLVCAVIGVWALRRYLDMEPLQAMNRADGENEKNGRGN